MDNQPHKPDRRVNRTRRQLRTALMDLILEKGYNAVTVQDITERADLGRTTFYLHFQDKEALLVDTLEKTAVDLKAQVEQIAAQEAREGQTLVNPVAVVFRHVDANRDLYRVILKGEGSSQALSRIRNIIEEAAIEFFDRHMLGFVSAPHNLPKGLVAGYFAGAMLGFITLWLEKELPYNGDDMAVIFMKLFFRGAASLLNLAIEI